MTITFYSVEVNKISLVVNHQDTFYLAALGMNLGYFPLNLEQVPLVVLRPTSYPHIRSLPTCVCLPTCVAIQ